MPDAGIRMIKGTFNSQGLQVRFVIVREVLLDIDPVGAGLLSLDVDSIQHPVIR